MTPDIERPASGGDRRGLFHSVHDANQHRINTPKVWFSLAPCGDPIVATGRVAQTLLLLHQVGANGMTLEEASVHRWARRISDYIFRLRALGVEIHMALEPAGDARVGRYTLRSRIIFLGEQTGLVCA